MVDSPNKRNYNLQIFKLVTLWNFIDRKVVNKYVRFRKIYQIFEVSMYYYSFFKIQFMAALLPFFSNISIHINMTTVISKHFGTSIFMESFA